jgi:hypothetical protein
MGKYKDLVALLVYTEVDVVDTLAGPKGLRAERRVLAQRIHVGFVGALVLEIAEGENVLGP